MSFTSTLRGAHAPSTRSVIGSYLDRLKCFDTQEKNSESEEESEQQEPRASLNTAVSVNSTNMLFDVVRNALLSGGSVSESSAATVSPDGGKVGIMINSENGKVDVTICPDNGNVDLTLCPDKDSCMMEYNLEGKPKESNKEGHMTVDDNGLLVPASWYDS